MSRRTILLVIATLSLFVLQIQISYADWGNTCNQAEWNFCSGQTVIKHYRHQHISWGYCSGPEHNEEANQGTCSGTQYCWNGACYDACSGNVNECKTYDNANGCTQNKPDGTLCIGGKGLCQSGICVEALCSDGIDNDGNGATDYDDPNCIAACAAVSSGGPDPLKKGIVDNRCCGIEQYSIISDGFESLSIVQTSAATVEKTLPLDLTWSFYVKSGGALYATPDAANKSSGAKSIKTIFTSAEGDIRTSQKLYRPGTYVVTAWVKGESFAHVEGDASKTGRITVLNSGNAIIASSMPLHGSYNWRPVSFEFIVPTTPTLLYISLGSFGGKSTGTIWFDDVSIIRKDLGDFGSIKGTNQYFCSLANNKGAWNNAGSNAFKIATVANQYDVVSNGNEWYSCSPGSSVVPNQLPASGLPAYVQPISAVTANLLQTDIESSIPIDSSTAAELQESVDQDAFLNGFTEVSSGSPSAVVSQQKGSTTIFFTIDPSEIGRLQPLQLKITGLPALNYIITNTSGFEIKVSDGTSFRSTKHAIITASGTVFNEFNVTLPTDLSLGSHDINITILSSSSTIYSSFILKNAFTIVEDYMSAGSVALEINPDRFLCYNETKKGYAGSAVLECCGPNYQYCINNDYTKTRISGGPTGLLKDYYASTGKNAVLRRGFSFFGPSYFNKVDISGVKYLEHGYDIPSLPITNWSNYGALEFDVLLLGSKEFNILITGFGGTALFDQPVMKYSLSGSQLGKWHHIKIPLSASLQTNQIASIRFYADQRLLVADVGSKRVKLIREDGTEGEFLQVFGLDRLFLSSTETKYCATDFDTYKDATMNVGRWISDLDEDKDACNNVPSYKWTSVANAYDDGAQTHCCGDDQGTTTQDETYRDVYGGCWKGMYVANNTIVPATIS